MNPNGRRRGMLRKIRRASISLISRALVSEIDATSSPVSPHVRKYSRCDNVHHAAPSGNNFAENDGDSLSNARTRALHQEEHAQ
jgi:hypothetical protein